MEKLGYGQAFGLMRAAAGPVWTDYTRHAFVEGLSDGSLPREAFLHYLRQDYLFLIHFSRAWALGVVKAGSLAEMQACSATVNALLAEEMQLHVRVCEAAGIAQAELLATPERAENAAYTRFVMDAGFSGDFLTLLAALAPCVMGYGEIGKRLAEEKTSDAYADWIATYAGEDYQALCRDVGALFDGALVARLGEGYADLPIFQSLSATFAQATELEVGFWQMGLSP
ncbi:MAG: thiaminase II [Paracoccaceae bacterium]|nr:thiaminase II [Paracoccaceae bacterium]